MAIIEPTHTHTHNDLVRKFFSFGFSCIFPEFYIKFSCWYWVQVKKSSWTHTGNKNLIFTNHLYEKKTKENKIICHTSSVGNVVYRRYMEFFIFSNFVIVGNNYDYLDGDAKNFWYKLYDCNHCFFCDSTHLMC